MFRWLLGYSEKEYLRRKHIKHGHPFDKSNLIEKLTSEKHPHTNHEFVYTVNIRTCNECGLHFNNCGLEFRNRKGMRDE